MADRRSAVRSALAVLLVGGCAAVREARLAQDPASAVPGERTPTAKELGLTTRGPLSLDDAVRTALQVHPSVLSARHDEEAAEARTGIAESAFLPDVSVGSSTQYRNQKQVEGGPPAGSEKHRFHTLGFQVSWLVFDFDRTPALARRAGLEWLAAQSDARDTDVDVALRVREAYYTLHKQQALVDVARDAVVQFQEHLDQVKEFVRVGTRIPYDETKADVDLGNARLLLVRAEDSVLTAQADLANAMGLAETTEWTPSADASLPPPPASFDECWDFARRNRPALASAEAREAAASELVNAQVAALYPSVSVGFGFNQSGSSTPFPWNWQVGPSVSWVPFDGFRNLYSIDEAVADLKSSRASRASIEQTAWLDVRSAWIAREDAHRRLELTTLLVRSAEENLSLAQGRFDAGLATAVELTDARQDLTKARADDVTARADVDLEVARLWKAMGAAEIDAATAAPGRNP